MGSLKVGTHKFLKKLWDDEAGQSTTEYILILAVVVMVALKFKTAFSSNMSNALDKLNSDMNSAMQ